MFNFFVFILRFLFHMIQVGKVYLLMRPKKGKSVDQRLEELTRNNVSDTHVFHVFFFLNKVKSKKKKINKIHCEITA